MSVNVCVPYVPDFKYADEVQEVNIKFNLAEDSYSTLLKFITENTDKRINISFEGVDFDMDMFCSFQNIHSKVFFKLQGYQMEQYGSFQMKGLKFFFDVPVYTWDMLHDVKEIGVSDVYISGELGFDLKRVKEVLDGINIRVIPNYAQENTMFSPALDHKAFFIRPEDMELYSDYVDTFELLHDNGLVKLETLFQIYAIDQFWFGDLADLITGLSISLANEGILDIFGGWRANCGKGCYKGSGCQICDRSVELASLLHDSHYGLTSEEIAYDEFE